MALKKIFFLIPIFFSSLSATPVQELFLRANQAYDEGDYARAQQIYQSIESKGPALWFNMGNCFYQQGNLVDALIAWRRAQKGAIYRVSKTACDSIARVKNKLEIPPDSGTYHLMQMINLFVTYVNVWVVQLLFLLCLAFLVGMGGRLWTIRGGKIMSVLCYILMTANFFVIFVSWYDMKHQRAIVREKEVRMYAGPENDYHVIGSCPLGTEGVIKEEKGMWYKMQCPHARGWLQKDACEVI